MKVNILLVEDEASLHDVIKLNLELEGYKVLSAMNGQRAIEIYKVSKVDLIILDVMMPLVDGFDVCQKIRLDDAETPILFLSARDETQDKLKGLELGADDYVIKPFHMKELLLRIKNLLKRSQPNSVMNEWHTYSLGNYIINFRSYEVTLDGKAVEKLSDKQSKLLKLLIENKGQVVSRKEILQKIWEYETIPNTRTIDNVILSFRKTFEQNGNTYFHSVRGVGYKFSENS